MGKLSQACEVTNIKTKSKHIIPYNVAVEEKIILVTSESEAHMYNMWMCEAL